MVGTAFDAALEGLEHVKSDEGEILTKPFLDVCKLVLSDKFGPAMGLVKSDIGGNISVLESNYSSNSRKYHFLYSIVRTEIEARAPLTCSSSLLWLTRAMDSLVELFHGLVVHPGWSMQQVCRESYNKTLRKYHGWLARSSFMMVMGFAPNRMKFMEVIGGGHANACSDMARFCSTFSPIVQENHKFLASIGLDY